MANKDELAAARLRGLLGERGWSIARLHRETGIPYKRLLAEVRHEKSKLSLNTAICSAEALGLTLPELLEVAA